MYQSRLTSKGQVTLPKAIREHLGVKPHDLVVFDVIDGRVVVRSPLELVAITKGALRQRPQFVSAEAEREAVELAWAEDVVERSFGGTVRENGTIERDVRRGESSRG
ncbi:MAG: AbrB/MazE/SpoVT family DNA-binding domain-containing protein [Chloroflexi bacterium]|nr:AbrB/MazE/SpoVT family DNA-binding domain-containing protein [Chloroflexota bacterium]